MKERPILFSGPMVRAILNGQKTQTRRVIKVQNRYWSKCLEVVWGDAAAKLSCKQPAEHAYAGFDIGGSSPGYFPCRYGKPGDRLWVRETWQQVWFGHGPEIIYRADNSNWAMLGDAFGKWKPSIHMFRWMSRITLEITDVGIERLQNITKEDAIAEGVRAIASCGNVDLYRTKENTYGSARDAFEVLWDSINEKPYPWSSNPWVWVVKFKRLPAEG